MRRCAPLNPREDRRCEGDTTARMPLAHSNDTVTGPAGCNDGVIGKVNLLALANSRGDGPFSPL